MAFALVLWSSPASAHDPSAWGGVFRSRDDGATWFLASPGRFASAALALAISPTDVNHLLLATDSGLLRSRNGGRDWALEAPTVLVGAVFAVAFSADGAQALVSTGAGVFRGSRENDWRRTATPPGAAPARAIVSGADAGRVYLAGWRGLFISDDWGDSWSDAARGLPDRPVTAFVAAPSRPGRVYAIAGGQIWERTDGARTWVVVLATDRGLYRTADGGGHWQLVADNLPAHLEAGALVRDPVDPATLYAGFALTPYPELWRRAAEGGTALDRVDVVSLAGGMVFLALMVLAVAAVIRRVRRYYR